jgi:molecular chaperone DnaJ
LNHPDHAGDASADDMSEINEAYRVLSDDSRRAAYDRQLEVGTLPTDDTPFTPPPTSTVRRPAPGPPARIPWRLMGAMAAIGIAVVLIGAAMRKPDTVRPPDGVLGTGSCVVIEANGDASETNCDGDGDLVVEVVVPFDSTCPSGTEPHRDRQGLGIACVIPINSR